jgi:signal transduction histidine kinase
MMPDHKFYRDLRGYVPILSIYHCSFEFAQLRYLIGDYFICAVGWPGIGSVEALSLSHRLHKITEAVDTLAHGETPQTFAEQGPDEIRYLLRSFNYLVERLQAMQVARQRLLANLIHELGRPLGALQVGLQAVVKNPVQYDTLITDLLYGMQEQVVRLRRLLDDLSQHYEQATGIRPDRQWINLAEWLPTTDALAAQRLNTNA